MYIKRCVSCMKEIEGPVCPYCGFQEDKEKQDTGVLRWNTILHGRYLVGKVLGQGGFGITYVGWDLVLDIKVAIKEYFPMGHASRNMEYSNELQWSTSMASQAQWKAGCENFLKEARKMAKIDSIPEIVRVRDTFFENNTAYIVMDFVDGVTMKTRLNKMGPMGIKECLKLLRPLMEGLHQVHEQGMIHRDISPDNIMILPDGKVRLLDFGAARDMNVNRDGASQLVTKRGFSPAEQYLEGGNIGPWTDVYAFTATIYYAVTGKLVPESIGRVMEDSLRLEPDPLKGLTKEVMMVFHDGMEISDRKRIQSMKELLERFDKAVGADGGHTPAAVSHAGTPGRAKASQNAAQKLGKAAVTGLAVIGALFIGLMAWGMKGASKDEPGKEAEKTAETTKAAGTETASEETKTGMTFEEYLKTDMWAGFTYTNPWLNLEIDFPEDSVIATENEIQELMGEGQEILFHNETVTEEQLRQSQGAAIYDFSITMSDGITNFMMLFEQYSGSAEEYLNFIRENFSSSTDEDFECRNILETKLGEETFQMLPIIGGDGTMLQRYYAKKKDGYIASLIVTCKRKDESYIASILSRAQGVPAAADIPMPDEVLSDTELFAKAGKGTGYMYLVKGESQEAVNAKINDYNQILQKDGVTVDTSRQTEVLIPFCNEEIVVTGRDLFFSMEKYGKIIGGITGNYAEGLDGGLIIVLLTDDLGRFSMENIRYFQEGSQMIMPDSLIDSISLRKLEGSVEEPCYEYLLNGQNKGTIYAMYISALEKLGLTVSPTLENHCEITGADGTVFRLEYIPDSGFTVSYKREPEALQGDYGFRVNGKLEEIGRRDIHSGYYIGEFHEDFMTGVGILEDEGERYEGEFYEGERDGFGTLYFSSGNSFKGLWDNGNYGSLGEYVYSDGTSYMGGWQKNGLSGGVGVELFTDGSSFVGEFRDGERNGVGIYIRPSKEKLICTWKDNEAVGEADPEKLKEMEEKAAALPEQWSTLLKGTGKEVEERVEEVRQEYERLKEKYPDVFPQD